MLLVEKNQAVFAGHGAGLNTVQMTWRYHRDGVGWRSSACYHGAKGRCSPQKRLVITHISVDAFDSCI